MKSARAQIYGQSKSKAARSFLGSESSMSGRELRLEEYVSMVLPSFGGETAYSEETARKASPERYAVLNTLGWTVAAQDLSHTIWIDPHEHPTVSAKQLSKTEDLLGKIFEAITAMESRIASLEKSASEEVIQVRDISADEAKKEIKAFFEDHHGETLYPDDVARALSIDVMQAVDICEELAREGSIGEEA